MSDPKKQPPKDMVEALEEGIDQADVDAGVKKKKPPGPNSEAFAELRKKIAERKAALDET